jgi:hypothetical protein
MHAEKFDHKGSLKTAEATLKRNGNRFWQVHRDAQCATASGQSFYLVLIRDINSFGPKATKRPSIMVARMISRTFNLSVTNAISKRTQAS